MLLDWVTVAAQLVNFAVLVAILRYFLYGRIIRTVEKREEEIQSQLEEVENQKRAVAREVQEHERRDREWEEERGNRLARVRREAEEKRSALEGKAREEVEELRRRWHQALESEKASFLRDLREGVGRHAHEIARKALADIADEELERQVLRVFCERIREASPERKEELKRAIEASEGKLELVSAFEIGDGERDQLRRELSEAIGRELDLGFETSPDVICGAELVTDGHKVGFSLGSYMSRLEEWAEESLASEVRDQRKGEGDMQDGAET